MHMGADEGMKFSVCVDSAVAERHDIGIVEFASLGDFNQPRSDGHAVFDGKSFQQLG